MCPNRAEYSIDTGLIVLVEFIGRHVEVSVLGLVLIQSMPFFISTSAIYVRKVSSHSDKFLTALLFIPNVLRHCFSKPFAAASWFSKRDAKSVFQPLRLVRGIVIRDDPVASGCIVQRASGLRFTNSAFSPVRGRTRRSSISRPPSSGHHGSFLTQAKYGNAGRD
jgi:hypothetical protein